MAGASDLPHPASFPDYALPMRARKLTQAELTEIEAAFRTGLYSVMQVAMRWGLSRSLAFALAHRATDPKRYNTERRTHTHPHISDEDRKALRK